MEKYRLDQLLINKGLVSSREKGKALIMAGQVYVNGNKVEKSGTNVNNDAFVEIKGELLPYVSRGGLKLAKALQEFDFALQDKVMLDIGASTGGFTDCALKNGAVKVYAVDVGYGQLAWSLRQDPRVVVMERKNARYLSSADIVEAVDVITIDVSFISLRKIIPQLGELLKEGGSLLALIKPQFEAGREYVGKKGVVKDQVVHEQIIREIITFSQDLGLTVQGLTYSPIKGPQGNIEFLLWLQKDGCVKRDLDKEKIKKIVAEAHLKL
ncbi:MAG: TlyA family RNA methyltransferase [Clostridia bacterium]|nr:TlyA family RNA methyltransferase [Clostridia bacterium]MDD4146171.1 TlyA family RNA methyltransferase [Clostridia bacterium]MDD4664940.1 TlyA family RNA methyltransferase [Clostridia bacterium]